MSPRLAAVVAGMQIDFTRVPGLQLQVAYHVRVTLLPGWISSLLAFFIPEEESSHLGSLRAYSVRRKQSKDARESAPLLVRHLSLQGTGGPHGPEEAKTNGTKNILRL